MSRGELIVNRVHSDGLDGHSAERGGGAARAPSSATRLAQRVARNLADFDVLVRRDRDTIARLSRAIEEPRADARPSPR